MPTDENGLDNASFLSDPRGVGRSLNFRIDFKCIRLPPPLLIEGGVNFYACVRLFTL